MHYILIGFEFAIGIVLALGAMWLIAYLGVRSFLWAVDHRERIGHFIGALILAALYVAVVYVFKHG